LERILFTAEARRGTAARAGKWGTKVRILSYSERKERGERGVKANSRWFLSKRKKGEVICKRFGAPVRREGRSS